MHGKPIRVLIVDDDRNVRRLYEREFRQAGYDVLLAENGLEAVEKFRTERPDLVILEFWMPGTEGIETLNRILRTRNKVPVILNGIYGEQQSSLMPWTADACVIKSSDTEPLKTKVREILAKRGIAAA